MRRKVLLAALGAVLIGAPITSAAVFRDEPRGGGAGAGGRIEGRVREAETGRQIGGAQVFVAGTVIGTLTDARGRYALDGVASGRVTVSVRLIGYAETSREVEVRDGETVTLDFAIERTALPLQDIVVTGEEGGPPPAVTPSASREVSVSASPRLRAAGYASAGVSRLDPDFNTESYALIEENGWKAPARDPLSTFSIDVDRASYSNVRRFITSGERPPIDAVRIEEMINYFPYDYPDADGEDPFGITTELAPAPWNEAHHLVRIGIQGKRVDLASLPPSNLVFLLDVSGSMQSPDKLPLVKRSLRLLVDELRPEDRVAIVVYAGAAGLVLESTPGRHRERILDAIERLEAGGSTAGGAGIRLAYEVAARNRIEGGNNRVILATDGDFNVGASSDAEMTRLIEEKRAQGTFLSVLGFGTGNLKDSKMEALADHGNGNYAYLDNLLEARKTLVTEMGGTLLTIAKDVKIQVEFNPARVQAYRLIGYENRLLAAEDFNDDRKDAGELGAGTSVTALYEIVPVGAPPVDIGAVDDLRYRRPSGLAPDREAGVSFGEASDELLFVKLRYKTPDGDRSRLIERPLHEGAGRASDDLRFAAAVAAFGMLLRDSEQCGEFTLDDVMRLARSGVGEDGHGYRSEFVRLVETTRVQGLLEVATR